MSAEASTALTEGVALLERAMGYTLGGLQLVTAKAMANETPCTQWDLRSLLLHMHESLATLHEAVAVGHLDLDPPGDPAGPGAGCGDPVADLVASLRNRACQMMGAWANARGIGEVSVADRALPSGIVTAAGALEVAVHGWDVYQACGQSRPIPAALAEELLELCPLLVRDADRPMRFAAPVEAQPSAWAGDRLVAYLGRRPN